MAEYPKRWESDVVLADGGTVHLRPVRRDDGDGLLGLYTRLSQESLYLRFFSPVPAPTARQIEALTTVDYARRFALVAELGEDIVAIARFDRLGDGEDAEVAFTVQDDQQGRGLGTILLEHLAGVARELGLRRFVASTLPSNSRMLQVFTDAGFQVRRHLDGGVFELSFPVAVTPASVEAERARAHVAEAHSVARLLAPSSVAVVGASRRAGTRRGRPGRRGRARPYPRTLRIVSRSPWRGWNPRSRTAREPSTAHRYCRWSISSGGKLVRRASKARRRSGRTRTCGTGMGRRPSSRRTIDSGSSPGPATL